MVLRNKLLFGSDFVIKSFSSKASLFREVVARNYFNEFNKPAIIGVYDHNLVMTLINGDVLSINEFLISDFKELINKILLNGVGGQLFNWQSLIENQLLTLYDDYFLSLLSFNNLLLIHGDLRPYNIIMSDDGLSLIDFEYSRNYIIEYDIAKFYIEALAVKSQLADDIFCFARNFNFANFLHSCLLIGYQQLMTSPYDVKLIKSFINDVWDEINNL